jgi:hypothetical protein
VRISLGLRKGSLAVPLLVLVIAILLIALLTTRGVVTAGWLVTNKNAIDAASTLVSTAVLVAGALVAYIKFFHGRLFRPKLNLKLNGGVFPGGHEDTLWIEAEISNEGVGVIYDYSLGLDAVINGHTRDFSAFVQDDVTGAPGKRVRVIDVGETAFAHAVITRPATREATTFRFFVTIPDQTLWSRRITLSAAAPPAPAKAHD